MADLESIDTRPAQTDLPRRSSMTDNSALPEIGAVVERLRGLSERAFRECGSGSTYETDAFDAHEQLADTMHEWLPHLLQSLTDLTRERDEAGAALNRGRHADEDCPIAAHLDDMYARSDDDQDKMHLAMAAYELRRGPFNHPDHFGCEIAADEMKARIAELELLVEQVIAAVDPAALVEREHPQAEMKDVLLSAFALRTAASSGGG